MIAISIVVSLRALSRLEETQTKHLLQLSSTYLDGLSTSLLPAVVREDVWEVFDTLDRSRERYKGLERPMGDRHERRRPDNCVEFAAGVSAVRKLEGRCVPGIHRTGRNGAGRDWCRSPADAAARLSGP